jgi:hypothetical protein
MTFFKNVPLSFYLDWFLFIRYYLAEKKEAGVLPFIMGMKDKSRQGSKSFVFHHRDEGQILVRKQKFCLSS